MTKPNFKTWNGCLYPPEGFPCNLLYPAQCVREGRRTWEQAVAQLCKACQPKAVKP